LPNLAITDSIAQALHEASDHLPVYLDLGFTKGASGVEDENVRQEKTLELSDRYNPVIKMLGNH
jgi:hypothetical protein